MDKFGLVCIFPMSIPINYFEEMIFLSVRTLSKQMQTPGTMTTKSIFLS